MCRSAGRGSAGRCGSGPGRAASTLPAWRWRQRPRVLLFRAENKGLLLLLLQGTCRHPGRGDLCLRDVSSSEGTRSLASARGSACRARCRGRSAPSSRRRSRAGAGSAVGRSGHTGRPVSEAHLGSRREEACLPGPWEDVGMCGGQLGGGRCRLREPLEPAQPVRVSGVFTSPKETGLAVADWGISGCKGQCAQDRRVTTALGGTVLHPG